MLTVDSVKNSHIDTENECDRQKHGRMDGQNNCHSMVLAA